MSSSKERQLEQCRAVYELVERGAIDAPHAALYRRELILLRVHGLVEKRADGAYVAVRAPGDSRPKTDPPPGPEPVVVKTEPMVTITARVSSAVVAALERLHAETRSDAIRVLLERAVDAGLAETPAGRAPGESSRSSTRVKTGTGDG